MFEAVMEKYSVCGIKSGKVFPSWGTAAQTLRRLFHWQRQASHSMEDASLRPDPQPHHCLLALLHRDPPSPHGPDPQLFISLISVYKCL